eukprot:m.26038 g.26038  ORF g.26038 m.26038 type:complete len:146 (-) comp15256_c0_seq1:124-561(-)
MHMRIAMGVGADRYVYHSMFVMMDKNGTVGLLPLSSIPPTKTIPSLFDSIRDVTAIPVPSCCKPELKVVMTATQSPQKTQVSVAIKPEVSPTSRLMKSKYGFNDASPRATGSAGKNSARKAVLVASARKTKIVSDFNNVIRNLQQ